MFEFVWAASDMKWYICFIVGFRVPTKGDFVFELVNGFSQFSSQNVKIFYDRMHSLLGLPKTL
jgi:hypothetical protein